MALFKTEGLLHPVLYQGKVGGQGKHANSHTLFTHSSMTLCGVDLSQAEEFVPQGGVFGAWVLNQGPRT